MKRELKRETDRKTNKPTRELGDRIKKHFYNDVEIDEKTDEKQMNQNRHTEGRKIRGDRQN